MESPILRYHDNIVFFLLDKTNWLEELFGRVKREVEADKASCRKWQNGGYNIVQKNQCGGQAACRKKKIEKDTRKYRNGSILKQGIESEI